MIGCGTLGKGDLTFFDNTCNVEGREDQHDPMIMQWRSKSEAATSLLRRPAQTSKTSASGAQEHANKEAGPQSLPIVMSSGSEHDSESEGGAQKHAPGEADPEPLPTDKRSAPEHDSENDVDYGTGENSEGEADEDQVSQASKDDIRSFGFALAKSLALLPEFWLPKKCKKLHRQRICRCHAYRLHWRRYPSAHTLYGKLLLATAGASEHGLDN